jgi:hypothetical protein
MKRWKSHQVKVATKKIIVKIDKGNNKDKRVKTSHKKRGRD